ncbi:immunoglobulin domain-containing protein, partial [Eisenibacter elegans]|uniref:immunoglobulin domain-containing protein n=1 Tax=Eisenibacter elegans TaxID=997 RepID=UPI00047EF4BB
MIVSKAMKTTNYLQNYTLQLLIWGLLCASWIGLSPLSAQTTYYVRHNATVNAGTSWATATTLQDALSKAVANDEIWLAQGTYTPGATRSSRFNINTNGIRMYGGFVGTETSLTQRDWQNNLTIISGDIGTVGVHTDNNFVLFLIGSAVTRTTRIDGLVFRHAYNDNPLASAKGGWGGAIRSEGAPTIINCTFENNFARWGAAIFNDDVLAFPEIRNCIFRNNIGERDAGGIYNFKNFNLSFDPNTNNNIGFLVADCHFENNTGNGDSGGGSLYGGGAMYNDNASGTVRNTTFTNNTGTGAVSYGGAIFNYAHNTYTGGMALNNQRRFDILIDGCTFENNGALTSGGAIQNTYGTGALDITRCTIINSNFANNSPDNVSNFGAVVVAPAAIPNVNLTVNNNKPIICRGDFASFTIQNAQAGVSYRVFRADNNVAQSGAVTGTGANLTLTTGNQLDAGTFSYYILARNTTTNTTVRLNTEPSVTINPSPTSTISTPSTTVCQGEPVTFTITETLVNYEFYVGTPFLDENLVQSGTSNTFTTSSLLNNQFVWARGTNANGCTSFSDFIRMTVNTPVTPSVSISASSTEICSGSNVSFTATPVNGGVSPTYQWRVNGSDVSGATSNTFNSSSLSNGDVVSVLLTSSLTCVSSATASSNTIAMTVNTPVTPSVSISASSTEIC